MKIVFVKTIVTQEQYNRKDDNSYVDDNDAGTV